MFKKGLWLNGFYIMIVRILAITMFFSQPNHEGILSTYDVVSSGRHLSVWTVKKIHVKNH